MIRTPCVLSVADHAGWAHVMAVAAPQGLPSVVARRRVALIEPGLPTMPYHHESLRLPVPDADALIARVREAIAGCSLRALRTMIADLGPACEIRALAIRRPQFAELPDSVAVVRQSYQLQCAADGMMYQLALRAAAADLGLTVHLCRRGEEMTAAASRLGVAPGDVETFVNGIGRPAGPPWTDEHRRAYAAAIAVLASSQVTPPEIRLR